MANKKSYGTSIFRLYENNEGDDETQRIFSCRFEDSVPIDYSSDKHEKLFCGNSVTTAKYNIATFIPRSLFEQFRRIANLYFLLISILMLLGTYTTYWDSPLTPWSTLCTLIIVLAISMTKEGVEDLKRHAEDTITNNQTCLRLLKFDDGSNLEQGFEEVKWEQLKVGNIIKIFNNQQIPADIVVLLTSELYGVAYIETANIDGEANLKIKNSAKSAVDGQTGTKWNNYHELQSSNIIIKCENPNSAIHHFNGSMIVNDATDNNREIGLDSSSFILRGSALKNTKWALGIITYTGRDTKLVMNSRLAPSKLSVIEQTINTLIYIIFTAQILISTASLIAFIIFKNLYYDDMLYLCYNYSDSSYQLFAKFCSSTDNYDDAAYIVTYFILYNNFIPISLYVTVEICNYLQAHFIDCDLELYHSESNTPAVARTSNMNSDLGMVEHIFSDKTGTLTENSMKFRMCSVGGHVFGSNVSNTENQDVKKLGTVLPLDELRRLSLDRNTPFSDFLIILAICHTVILEKETNDLQAESPDEEALVKAAYELGYKFYSRSPGRISLLLSNQIKIHTQESIEIKSNDEVLITFEILATIPFDSTRKRMSVVIRQPNGQISVYTKGADNIIFGLSDNIAEMRNDNLSNSMNRKTLLMSHLDLFGTDGLRTLLLAKRDLTVDEFQSFYDIWSQSERALINREALVIKAASLVECSLTVIGATAIEDKLQKGVPQTISDLSNAGIKMWVLTGDKLETAINIGYSSKLLVKEMVLIKLQDKEGDIIPKKKLYLLLKHFNKLVMEGEDALMRSWIRLQNSIYSIIFGSRMENDEFLSDTDSNNPYKQIEIVADMISSQNNTSTPTDIQSNMNKYHNSNNNNTNNLNNNEDSPLIPTPLSQKAYPSLSQITTEHVALVVDGEFLSKVFGDPQAERLFLSLSMICKAVIACRVSPEQKRLVVRLVKKGLKPQPVTLSIGDGANDVAMIQEAHIGVGISGKEGRQAVNSSDFSFAQFRYLKRLLLVHGRLDYRRLCKVVLYCFYKNVVLTLVLFLYSFVSAYGGQSLFEDNIYTMYNLVLALPVICFGIFDRDLSEETLLKYNFFYLTGRKRLDLNISVIAYEMVQASMDALLIFFVSYAVYHGGNKGYSDGIWVFGTTVYTALIISMFVRCAMLTYTWTWVSYVCIILSFLFYFLFLIVYQYIYSISYNFYGIAYEMMSHPIFWSLIILIPTMTGLMELVTKMVRAELFPSMIDIGREFDLNQAEGGGKQLFPYYFDPKTLFSYNNYFWNNNNQNNNSNNQSELSAVSESDLKFSSVLNNDTNNDISKRKFPLDWDTIKNMFTSMKGVEKDALGVVNLEEIAAPGSSFNYDHVARNYGPGGGNFDEKDEN
eukprot:gene7214-9844_t